MITAEQHKKGRVLIFFSFIIAIMLTALPLPDWALNWRPSWIALVLIYWCMAVPDRVGLSIAWCMGLVLDVQQGIVLGQNALCLTLLAYLIINSYQRMRVYSLIQQSVLICFYLLFCELIMLLTIHYFGTSSLNWMYWMPAVTSMLVWPWLFIILRDLRRRYQVS